MWQIGPNQCDSWSSFGNQSQLKQFRQFQALTQFPTSFHIGPNLKKLRDTQTSNLAIPGQREWRGQTLGICRRQRRSYQMCPRWNGQFTVGERITYQDLYFVITILLKNVRLFLLNLLHTIICDGNSKTQAFRLIITNSMRTFDPKFKIITFLFKTFQSSFWSTVIMQNSLSFHDKFHLLPTIVSHEIA
jgi:hypothetical protein